MQALALARRRLERADESIPDVGNRQHALSSKRAQVSVPHMHETVLCAYCARQFQPQRAHKQFCQPACRQEARRQRRDHQRYYTRRAREKAAFMNTFEIRTASARAAAALCAPSARPRSESAPTGSAARAELTSALAWSARWSACRRSSTQPRLRAGCASTGCPALESGDEDSARPGSGRLFQSRLQVAIELAMDREAGSRRGCGDRIDDPAISSRAVWPASSG
jgi:hypothetical protein